MSRLVWIASNGAAFAAFAMLSVCSAAEPSANKAAFRQKLTSLQKILNTMPKDSQPGREPDEDLQRVKASEWLKKNIADKPIDFKARLTEAKVVTAKEGKYVVDLEFRHRDGLVIPAGTVQSGGENWRVVIGLEFEFFHQSMDEVAVKRLQMLQGKDVTIIGKVLTEESEVAKPGGEQLPEFYLGIGSDNRVLRTLRFELHEAGIKDLWVK